MKVQWRNCHRMRAKDVRKVWDCGLHLKRIIHDDKDRTTPTAAIIESKSACRQATRGLKWATVEWHTSTGLHESLMAELWPEHVRAYFARPDRITFDAERPCPLRRGNTGTDTKHSRLSHYTEDLIQNIEICTDEVNPDRDVVWEGPSATCTISPEDNGGCLGVSLFSCQGSYAGTVSLHRATSLVTTQHNNKLDCEPMGPMQDVVALLKRYNLKYDARPKHLRKEQASRWRLPSGMPSQLQEALQLEYEWFASPLDRCFDIPQSASAHPEDARFGALVNAYSHKWTGSGLFHPPHGSEEARRALRWAVMSSCEPQPVLNFGVLVHKNRNDLRGLHDHSHVHVLCTHELAGQGQQFPFARPDFYMNQRVPYESPSSGFVTLVLVANDAGITKYYQNNALRTPPSTLQGYTPALHTNWLTPTWSPHRPSLDFPITKAFQKACTPTTPNKRNDCILTEAICLEDSPTAHPGRPQTKISGQNTPVVHRRQQTRRGKQLRHHRLSRQSLHPCCNPHITHGACPTAAHVCTSRNGSNTCGGGRGYH